ncbi:type I restriction enzyme endonuclease domain-containing protein [Actinocorallia sp. B10E7]|uniref:type I restriction enzyme endonuclease domain-containing protein n=1 Tax=Actinocorallia sp. B10E7 TaxID=3153558 RepID=UPI00325F0C1B
MAGRIAISFERDVLRSGGDLSACHRTIRFLWKVKEQARGRIMARALQSLRKYGYPPDKQPAAIERVLKQAEDMADKLA